MDKPKGACDDFEALERLVLGAHGSTAVDLLPAPLSSVAFQPDAKEVRIVLDPVWLVARLWICNA